MIEQDLFQGSFADFALPTQLQEGLERMGYEKPTRVQSETFQPVCQKQDLIVQSHTGSGKTLAFLLPLAMQIDTDVTTPSVLILTPTRELTQQVYRQMQQLGQATQIKSLAAYGGASLQQQIEALQQGVHMVVATPGRCKDLMNRGELCVDSVANCVLDEADEMLSRGFWQDVTEILDRLPTPRQTLLFSATLPPEIQQVCEQLMNKPLHIDLSQQPSSKACIDHLLYLENSVWPKPRNLLYMLELAQAKQGIIFCNRRSDTGLIERYLRNFGYHVRALNGDMPQTVREKALQETRDGELDFLVATDIAARGIDISSLSHVFNYGLPESEEVYVHRIGRTGRMGKKGVAISLAHSCNLPYLDRLSSRYELTFARHEFPDEQEILKLQAQRLLASLVQQAKNVECGQYQALATMLLSQQQAADAVAFLLRSHFAAASAAADTKQDSEAQQPSHAQEGNRSRRRDSAERKAKTPRTQRSSRKTAQKEDADSSQESDQPPDEQRSSRSSRSKRGTEEVLSRKKRQSLRSEKPVRLYINLGKADGFPDLVTLAYYLSNESNVDLGCFTGVGSVREASSHVEIDPQQADQVLEAFQGKSFEDKTLICERAQRTRGAGRSSRR